MIEAVTARASDFAYLDPRKARGWARSQKMTIN
jgi:hypothetical protein